MNLARNIRLIPAIIVSFLTMSACGDGVQSGSLSDRKTFGDFIVVFREAVVAQDYERIASLAKFPVQVKEDSDSESIKLISHDELVQLVPSVLQQDVGLSENPETVIAFFTRGALVSTEEIDRGEVFFGPMVFARVSGQWYLTRLYVEAPGSDK